MATTNFLKILQTLTKHDVKFVVVGAMSAALQGAQISTFDIDIIHERSAENITRLVAALAELDATHRGHPAKLPVDREALAGLGHAADDAIRVARYSGTDRRRAGFRGD